MHDGLDAILLIGAVVAFAAALGVLDFAWERDLITTRPPETAPAAAWPPSDQWRAHERFGRSVAL